MPGVGPAGVGTSSGEMFKNLYIERERLLLRPFEMADLPAFQGLVSQPEVMRYLPEGVMSAEEAQRILTWLIESYDVNRPDRIRKFTVAVALREGHEIAGWCGLGPLEYDQDRIELYYGISHSLWGREFATEASQAMLDYGFETIGLEEIVAVVSPENTASRRVVEKLSMLCRGEIRGLPPAHKDYEGSILYSLCRQERDVRERRRGRGGGLTRN